jgi:hypothetical protein
MTDEESYSECMDSNAATEESGRHLSRYKRLHLSRLMCLMAVSNAKPWKVMSSYLVWVYCLYVFCSCSVIRYRLVQPRNYEVTVYICRYRTGRVKLSGCKSWYVCIIDMHADVVEYYTRFQDETDFRNIRFLNLLEERFGIEKDVTNGRRYTCERPTRCTLFLINLFQLNYLVHEFDIQRTVRRDIFL